MKTKDLLEIMKKAIPYKYSEWEELPEYHSLQFEYTDQNGMMFMIIDHDPRSFVERINDILGISGMAYIFKGSTGKIGLHIKHPDKTRVRLSSEELPNLEPWTFASPFLWMRDKILNLFKS